MRYRTSVLARRLTLATPLSCIVLAAAPVSAADYWVAPNGNDNNPGTEQAPFASLGKGQQAAVAGDTVWVRGGMYRFTSGTVGVAFNKAGQAGKPIQYFAVPGEVPIFDLSAIVPTGRVTGFDVHTSFVHIRGMEITGVPQFQNGQDSWGLRIQGSNNVIERMNVHHNEAPGIFITSGANNLILNCDSHHNYDVLESGGSGDGFGCHSTGSGNVLRGCRAWSNSDDGYDFINAPGVCTAEQSWAWRNGWIPDTSTGAGNGAGFKAGGFGLDTSKFPAQPPVHVIQQCVAWNNRSQGFYANHHPGALHFFNNTAFDNPKNFDLLDDVGPGTHVLRNNVAFGTGGTVTNSTDDDIRSNSWNGGLSVTQDDFLSIDDALASSERSSDGALPQIAFLHLANTSALIDSGEDVGLAFSGLAPDLGAFETGDVTSEEPEPTDQPSDGVSSSSTFSGGVSTGATRDGSEGAPSDEDLPSIEPPTGSGGPNQPALGSETTEAPPSSTTPESTTVPPSPSATAPNSSSTPTFSGATTSAGPQNSGEDADHGTDGCGCSLGRNGGPTAPWRVALLATVVAWCRRRPVAGKGGTRAKTGEG